MNAAQPAGRQPFMPFSRLLAWIPTVLRGYGQGDLDEGVLVVQKDAAPDGFDVWVAAVVHHTDAETVPATVTVADQRLELALQHYRCDPGVVRGVPADARFFHAHASVAGLDAGTTHTVTAEIAGQPAAFCRARTLPPDLPTGRPLQIFAGSCYDVGTDPRDNLQVAYASVFPEPPDLTVMVGDQVYADAPFSHYWLRSRKNPRAGLLLKYWVTYGMSRTKAHQGLRGVLATGPNYFLPDDHEFWNNWPNQSVTAKDSYAHIGAALLRDRRRERAVVADDATLAVALPIRPELPPTDPAEQSYLPTHPAERGRWSLASFELFGAFQTRSRADRLGRPSRGADDPDVVGPPAAEGPAVNPPRNVIVQTVDVDPVTVCLLDTRTRRTRRLRHPVLSGFVDQVYLDEMLEQARRAAILVLATPQPLLSPAAWLTKQGTQERFGPLGDVDMWDYWYQWERLWAGLIAARDGRPTITIGGDIHQNYLAFAAELNLIEVVASPMSLVWGGNLLRSLQRFKRSHALDYSPGSAFVALRDVVAGPSQLAPALTSSAVAVGCLPKNVAGFAGLSFERAADGTVTAAVALYDRDKVAGDRVPTPAVAARYALALDARGPAARSVTPL